MHKVLIAVVLFALTTSSVFAAQCRDEKGKFIKCPPPHPAKVVHCRDHAGKFIKCGLPGAKPY